jgi:hypothetical protein
MTGADRSRRGQYPVSTLERALTTPHVREQLGIEIVAGRVVTAYSKPEVLKGLTKLVDEIGSGKVKVADFMRKEDRTAYIDKFKDEELPDPTTRTETQATLDEAPEKVTVDGRIWDVYLRFKRTYRPYTMHLYDFTHEQYLGTTTARNYASHIRLTDPERGQDKCHGDRRAGRSKHADPAPHGARLTTLTGYQVVKMRPEVCPQLWTTTMSRWR